MEIARVSALAELASGIAHELNQPLGAIATFSQAGDRLLNRPEPMVNRALEVFRQISSEALSAGEGIRRIRRLFDQAEPTCSRQHVQAVVQEILPIIEMSARRAQVGFEMTVAGSLPDVALDSLRIQHVLLALTQNAIEASGESARTRKVELAVTADRYAVEISIQDSGPGIPDAARDQLFRPFFTTKRNGTGLGLASSRAIIEAHGGTIGFDCNVTQGARFWFRLPILRSDEAGSGEA